MNKIVKITKAKYPTYWYAEFVGETREVAVSDDFPHKREKWLSATTSHTYMCPKRIVALVVRSATYSKMIVRR